jgi:hypothetical protein
MVEFGKFVHSSTGKMVMSILLGFGLATLFRTVCKGKGCVIFHAPPLEEIEGKTYKIGNKCYQYVPTPAKCNNNKNIIEFA